MALLALPAALITLFVVLLLLQRVPVVSIPLRVIRTPHASILRSLGRFRNYTELTEAAWFESSMNGPTPDVPIQDIFALYRGHIDFGVNYLRAICAAMADKHGQQDGQWVEAFQAEGTEGHSSSIVDLFDSLRSPNELLQDLECEDNYQDARFFTA
ncbi:hypothetical protein B0H11DRAFT_2421191, partial [Mycena galericulata]